MVRRLANNVLKRMLKNSVFEKFLLRTSGPHTEVLFSDIPNSNTQSAMMFSLFSFSHIIEEILGMCD